MAFTPFSERNQPPITAGYVYDFLPVPFRFQAYHIWDEIVDDNARFERDGYAEQFYSSIGKKLLKEYGLKGLSDRRLTPKGEVVEFFQSCQTALCLDVIEFIFNQLGSDVQGKETLVAFSGEDNGPLEKYSEGVKELNRRFGEHSLGYELQDGQIVRVDSTFLHQDAVQPAAIILKETYLAGANREFVRAMEHYRHGRYGAAMNECLKAFESTMKCICHKRGWAYSQNDTASRLLTACADGGLFPTYMQTSLNGLRAVLENVATFRNRQSGHGQGVQSIQIDAETVSFIMHSTAANILFLASLEKKLP